MNKELFYEPFMIKLTEWVAYVENSPKSDYQTHAEEYDAFRAANDRDCILTDGNLYADTIFSLWLPLRNTITRINSREAVEKVGKIKSKYSFCKCLLDSNQLDKLLPQDSSVVKTLRELFVLGLKRCNVMLLTDRRLNSKRGMAPYYDYIPRFLYELFPGGDFEDAFESEKELVEWINREKLHMLFDGEICRENIRDLSGSGDLKVSLAPAGDDALEQMLRNYYTILKIRDMYY